LDKHSRNFGPESDDIAELSSLLSLATELGVNLHLNWDRRYPDQWELNFIENRDAARGSCSRILRMLTQAADRHGKEILGYAQNTADSRLPPDQWLLEWYEKHGFHRIPDESSGVPIRRPSRHESFNRAVAGKGC
jgi:hypothetical protein